MQTSPVIIFAASGMSFCSRSSSLTVDNAQVKAWIVFNCQLKQPFLMRGSTPRLCGSKDVLKPEYHRHFFLSFQLCWMIDSSSACLQISKWRWYSGFSTSFDPHSRGVLPLIRKAVQLAVKNNSRLHLAHLSTVRELDLLQNDIPLAAKMITVRLHSPSLVYDRDYEDLGSLIKWNPAIRLKRPWRPVCRSDKQ